MTFKLFFSAITSRMKLLDPCIAPFNLALKFNEPWALKQWLSNKNQRRVCIASYRLLCNWMYVHGFIGFW